MAADHTKQMDSTTLFEKLMAHHERDMYPFHMPGHKRNMKEQLSENLKTLGALYEADITEIDGFDSLHHAEGVLKEISRKAASWYHADETFLLINGSTSGLLCAISACVSRGGHLLMARNSHRAAYHAAYLRELRLSYVQPAYLEQWDLCGGVPVSEVEAALKAQEDIEAVLITSPTYEGMVSDISAIAKCCHAHGALLIVDEAHGAHFGGADCLPESAITQGADVVIQSLHKTMPALTQTALLHVKGSRADRQLIRRFFSIYQSSSPSYVLMAGIDECLSLVQRMDQGAYEKLLCSYRKRLVACKHVRLVSFYEEEQTPVSNGLPLHGRLPDAMRASGCYAQDPGRFVFSVQTEGMSGKELMDCLRAKYHLELEMAAGSYVVAIVTMMDHEAGMNRLCQAIEEIDRSLQKTQEATGRTHAEPQEQKKFSDCSSHTQTYLSGSAGGDRIPVAACGLAEAYEGAWEACPFWECAGRVMAEFVLIYPPGIPLIVPGEVMDEALLRRLSQAKEAGLSVEGMADETMQTLRVQKE